ncbi:sn-glycerol-3-phosphate ABC transporter ATP-binding protein UgpC [Cognatishimia sp. SS12]|uniref:ABC transporter ATP-binding protein n=1 Tax=Cognatishimia sp. SS12 TaxID=2979465 RepID=UPI00232D17A1|nr:sn-glycerol-3-phosphate ABC transporter ATP-binding protein UgpC [Cognatishimia sp. SS12]MDC0739603.1 sn-glycerol-3-phosphate ABC transporter ATP-binding protein UgpC [Cognatishimia sp. SS12]
MAHVAIKDIYKNYGAVRALKGIDFEINDGEFVALVGPSGCGKTTLLRMIAGLEDITGGEIHIAGRVVNDLQPKARDIAMVFQNYALYPHMKVADNMSFSMQLAGAPKDEIKTKVEEAARILNLENYLDRYPRELSGGQRQRVAMGRAIVRNPKVFLFDEPLSNLDAKLRVSMRAEIKALHQRLGTTAVYVTHDQIEAMTMADKIVVMSEGHVEQVGTPLELYDEPQNLFVAAFIGSPSMNLMEATVTESGLKIGSFPEIATQSYDWLPTGKEIVVGMRPYDFAIGDTGLKLDVSVTEPTGVETQVAGHIEGKPVTCLFKERVSGRYGDTMHVTPNGPLHVFDKETGQRLGTAFTVTKH